MRVWHQPHPQQQQSRGLQPHSRLVQSTQALRHSTSGAVLRHSGVLPFKRYLILLYRLSVISLDV